MNYLGRTIADIDPFTPPADTTAEEWKAYLSRLYDFTGALLSRDSLPADMAVRITSLRSNIADTLI
ncbi:hypothetical protein [Streptomyces sp. NBC_01361]|uniref:hypothetical protein n=1 Tax=Streptomyces sp. NBC_01361 TaxID=2903838 RepID=UPI002E3668FC|nr:hypothetical protein [Streptomyces sp. NBC_01361]